MFWKRKVKYDARQINAVWRKILDNHGLPRAPQFTLDNLLSGINWFSQEDLRKLIERLFELTEYNLKVDIEEVEIAIIDFDINIFSYTGFPAIEDLQLVYIEYSELETVQRIEIKFNSELLQFILCELVVLISNCSAPAHAELPLLSDTKQMTFDDVVYSIFNGFGLILLNFNQSQIDVHTSSEVFRLKHDYILSNNDMMYAISLWNSMYPFEYNLIDAMNPYFQKDVMRTIEEFTQEVKKKSDFEFEFSDLSRSWFRAHLEYEQLNFTEAIEILKPLNADIIESADVRSEFYFFLGECCFFEKRFDDAFDFFNRSYQLLEGTLCLSYLLLTSLLISKKLDKTLLNKLLFEVNQFTDLIGKSPIHEYMYFVSRLTEHYAKKSDYIGVEKFEFKPLYKENQPFINYCLNICNEI